MWYSVRTLNFPSIICPDDENIPSGPSPMSRSFEGLQLASVQTFQQHVRTPLSVRSAMGFLFKTKIWEDNCNCPDALINKASRASKSRSPNVSLHGPNAWASYMEIASIRSTVRTTDPMVRTREALIWKLRPAKVQPFGQQGNIVLTRLKSGWNF
jgi:hypothetical protein